MEMNFPHKSLHKAGSDYSALMAQVIARQALTPSARAYAMRSNYADASLSCLRDGWMEDRISLFAGERQGPEARNEKAGRFLRGHFRPDLASRVSSRQAVQL